MARKIKVALFFGGTSKEREVSFSSAKAVAKHLNQEKFKIFPIEVGLDGKWLTKSSQIKELSFLKEERLNQADTELAIYSGEDAVKGVDVAFLALHGPGGEDGSVQGMLDLLKIPYTSSGVQASSLAIDKNKTKRLVATAGVLVAPQLEINKHQFAEDPESFLNKIHGKVVFKPNGIGSSFGITITDDKKEYKKAIELALQYSDEVLVEEFIEGKEFTVPVIGNNDLQALPVVEVIPKNGSTFFDFKAKYSEEYRDEIVPARIPEKLTQRLQEQAIKVHKLLGCRCVTRTDFIVTPKDEIYFLEINTIPGLTEVSLVPQSAAAAGISYPELLEKIIQLALEK